MTQTVAAFLPTIALAGCNMSAGDDTQITKPVVWRAGEPIEKLQGLLRQRLEEMDGDILSFDDANLALPPWEAFPSPKYSRFSLGWRMGTGEDYWHHFRDWYAGLTNDEKMKYGSTYPSPIGWEDFYEVMDR